MAPTSPMNENGEGGDSRTGNKRSVREDCTWCQGYRELPRSTMKRTAGPAPPHEHPLSPRSTGPGPKMSQRCRAGRALPRAAVASGMKEAGSTAARAAGVRRGAPCRVQLPFTRIAQHTQLILAL